MIDERGPKTGKHSLSRDSPVTIPDHLLLCLGHTRQRSPRPLARGNLCRLAGPGGEKAEDQKLYINRWLFTPATVLSAVDPEPGVVLIRTKDMEVHRRVQR